MAYHVGAPSFIQKFVNLGLTKDMGCYRHCKEGHCNKAIECVEEFQFICEKNAWHKCVMSGIFHIILSEAKTGSFLPFTIRMAD